MQAQLATLAPASVAQLRDAMRRVAALHRPPDEAADPAASLQAARGHANGMTERSGGTTSAQHAA